MFDVEIGMISVFVAIYKYLCLLILLHRSGWCCSGLVVCLTGVSEFIDVDTCSCEIFSRLSS